jgi:ATP-binding cassette subfamily C (CFTR/MRP) protein 1
VLLTLPAQLSATYIASLAASIVAAPFLSIVLVFEQRRFTRPSDIGSLYLVASITCDLLLVTIPSGISAETELSAPILIRLVVHLVILVLENQKRSGPPLDGLDKPLSPEEQSGILGRAFFFWVNPVLLLGYRNLLVGSDLPPLHGDIEPKVTRKNILRAWDQRG